MQRFTVWASAGCGKTEFCTNLAAQMIERRVCQKDEILYTTFQKTAARDAAERAGIYGEEYRRLWYRTLHSACYRLLRIQNGATLTAKKMQAFGDHIGVQISDDLSVEDDEQADLAQVTLAMQRVRSLSEDAGSNISKLLAMYHHSRLTSWTLQDLDAARHEPSASAQKYFGHLDHSKYREVVELYEGWKANQIFDFVDMLERVAREPIVFPRWKIAFIDEAQDLSPLQLLVISKMVDQCEKAFYVGDSFQAIMSFQGASADGFLSYRNSSHKIHLPQTYRFGQSIVDLGRSITDRLPDADTHYVIPAPGKENPIRKIWSLDDAGDAPGKKFYLHRHREGCNAIARKLISEGKPFWCERGTNPLGKPSQIAGYMAIRKLLRMEPMDGLDIQAFLGVVGVSREIKGDRVKLLKHGSKAELSRMEPTKTLNTLEVVNHLTPFLWDELRAEHWGVTDITFAEYYKSLEESGFPLGTETEPEITISTIHGSKGRDADTVFLWDELLEKCLNDVNENRVWYVGVTRTKGPLYIVHDPVTVWNTSSYPYLPRE